jgi:hypothetical protein
MRHGQRAAGQKIILQINDDQRVHWMCLRATTSFISSLSISVSVKGALSCISLGQRPRNSNRGVGQR